MGEDQDLSTPHRNYVIFRMLFDPYFLFRPSDFPVRSFFEVTYHAKKTQ